MALDDSYSKALLHFDGADASTTFTDESGKTWSAAGNAQIDTAQSVFGGASLLLDGVNDYIDTPYSTDWYLDDGNNTHNWTIDFRVNLADTNKGGICSRIYSSTGFWSIHMTTDWLYFISMNGTVKHNLYKSFGGSINTWYHVAIVKDGTTYRFFKDGTSLGTSTSTDVLADWGSGTMKIGQGRDDTTAYSLNGHIDEFRLSKGIARWTSDFTVPTSPYGGGGPAGIKKILGVASASIKKTSGVVYAGVKKISGVS